MTKGWKNRNRKKKEKKVSPGINSNGVKITATSEINSDDENNIDEYYKETSIEDVEYEEFIADEEYKYGNLGDSEYLRKFSVELTEVYMNNTDNINTVYEHVLKEKCKHYKKFLDIENEFDFTDCENYSEIENDDSNTIYNILPRVKNSGVIISRGLDASLPKLEIEETEFKILDNVGKVNRYDILKNIILRIDPNDTVVDKINIKLDLLIEYIRKTFFLYNLYYSAVNTFDIRDLANYKNINTDNKLLLIKKFISIFPVNFNKKEVLIEPKFDVKLELSEDGKHNKFNFYNGDRYLKTEPYNGNIYKTFKKYEHGYDLIFFSFFIRYWNLPLTESNKILIKFFYLYYDKLRLMHGKFYNLFASRDITTENLNNNIDLIVFILNLNFYNNLPNYGNFKSFTYVSECEENLKKNNNIVIYI
jgi:hypothetical protein